MDNKLVFIIISIVLIAGILAVVYFRFGDGSKIKNRDNWQPLITEDNALSTTLKQISEKYKQPAMACALVDSSGIITRAAVGSSVYGEDMPVDIDSRFHIGSITKSMTALLIQMLVDEGKLSYDTTLEQALPDIHMRADYRNVTIRELLLSKAGIIAFQRSDLEDQDMVDKLWSKIPAEYTDPTEQRREVAKLALNLTPIVEPGSKAIYSNVGWSIVGLIAENTAGKQYEELVKERIFEPLGMKDARIGGWPASAEEPGQPRGHYPGTGRGKAPQPQELDDVYTFPDWMNPSGGVHCSIMDFALYVLENLAGLEGQGKLLGKDGYENIHSVHLTVEISEMYIGMSQKGDLNLGYGWGIVPTDSGNLSAAEGSGGTFYAIIYVYPALDAGFVGFTNAGDGSEALGEAVKRITGLEL